MKIIRRLLPLSLVFALSLVACLPLFKSGFFSMHDDQQVARLFEMNKSLLAGQFPVRWVQGFGFGLGYPLFNFYPPFLYYLGVVFHLVLGLGFLDSIKLVWAVALVGSAFAMYFLSKELFGKVAAIVCSMFYLYSPYHAIDSYVRGALAELFSFVWLPLILLFSFKLVQTGKLKFLVWTGIVLSLLMITHNLIFLPFLPLTAVWYFWLILIFRRSEFFRFTIYFILFLALCFSLSAFFWLPSLAEKQYTLVDQLLIKNLASYSIHFVCPSQLWDSAWGFGGSISGCVDGLSFKLGKIHAVLSVLSLLSLVIIYRQSKNIKLILIVVGAFFLLLLSIFLTLQFSKPVWDKISLLWYLQFPWRFLEFAALFSSLIVGSVIFSLPKIGLKIIAASIFVILLFWLNAKLFVPQQFFPSSNDESLTSKEEINWRVSSTSFEYLPKEVSTKKTNLKTVGVDIDKNFVLNFGSPIPSDKNAIVEIVKNSPQKLVIKVRNPTSTQIELPVTNFPGWHLTVDGKEVKINHSNKFNLISTNLVPGNHEIVAILKDTLVRKVGNAITLVTVILLLIYFVYGNRRSKTKSN